MGTEVTEWGPRYRGPVPYILVFLQNTLEDVLGDRPCQLVSVCERPSRNAARNKREGWPLDVLL